MQFDKITFEIEPVMYPGKFAAKVVAWHRGVAVYSKQVLQNSGFRSVSDDLTQEIRIVAAMVARGKLLPDPAQLPPTTKVQ